MSDYDLVIRGGTVVTAADVFRADVGVRDGVIAALATDLGPGRDTIEADGLLVLPGGIDSHVHIEQPTSDGTVMADDFASGTRSAAFGGNTTVLPFALQQRGQSLRLAVDDYRQRAKGHSFVDYGFHLILTDPSDQVLGQELPALVRDGYTSLKVFMTYPDMKLDDLEILNVMAAAHRERALVMIHAENYDAIRFLTEHLEQAGHTEPRGHARSRPIPVEREATHRAVTLAEIAQVPLVVVHVSNGEALEEIIRAQRRGLKIFAETCPQYLVLTEKDLDGLNMAGEKYVCSPPPRDEASQKACWQGLEQGLFEVFSSDHCPFRYEGPTGKRHKGERTAFRWVPNGIPGVETRLPILFSEGVGSGRITLPQFVALTATNHAKLYGLYPRKGSLAVGADADITLWDPNRRETIRQHILHHGCDYTPYEGFEVRGWPVTTLLRGRVVVGDGQLLGAPQGAFQARGPSAAVA
ncbi:MAG: dihydropyrimidinase [Candidatus Competibacterales bacterium]